MRNLGLIISFWLSVFSIPTNSFALGLGDITVNSFLNQPLDAEIEVISARPGEIDDLLVSLASRDAFARAGLSRPISLSELKFTVQKSEEGDSAVILVTTKSAIKEPFLNFLVEADWSKGRLLREFTVLLDPPFYADSPLPEPTQTQQPEAIEPSQADTVSEQQVPAPIVESDTTSTASSTSEQQTITEPIALSDEDQTVDEPETTQSGPPVSMTGNDVLVEKGDTLWSIASALKGSGYSMSQIMLAIQNANPDAFNDNNINNMKVGSVLRMPSADEIGALDQQQAYAEVLEQNGLWDDYVARVTGQSAITTGGLMDGSTVEESTDEPAGELTLVTPGDGTSDAAGLQTEGEDANELRIQLTLAEEELDASRVQNRELESRIAELEAQLSKFEELQKMVEIEDDSLAKLQEQQAQESEDTVVSEAISEAQKSADEDALLEELLAEDEQAQAAADEAVVAETTGSDGMVDDSPVETEQTTRETVGPVAETTDTMVEETTADEKVQTPPPPVIITEPVMQEPSLLDGLLPAGLLDMLPDLSGGFSLDPIMLGGLGGILLLLIGLVIYRRKKASEDVVVNDPIFAVDGEEEEEELTPIHLAEGAFEGLEEDSEVSITEEASLPVSMTEEDEVDDFSKTAVISADEMPTPEEQGAPAVDEQDDILNEADVYLAYNLYDNAEDLLTSSLEANPERADYRAKLLDTYFATRNVDAFVSQAETLKSMGRPADRYWDRVMVMGFELAPQNDLFAAAKDSGISAADLEFSKPAAADFDLGVEEDDTNFSTTDFDLGEEDTGTFEATDFSSGDLGADLETQQLDDVPGLADDEALVDEDSVSFSEGEEADAIPDDIGDLDFSFDDDEDSGDDITDIKPIEEVSDELDFGLPDELDLGADDQADERLDLGTEATAVLEAGTAVIDTDAFTAGLDDEGDDLEMEATAVIETDTADDEIDFGMEETAMIDSLDVEDDVVLDLDDSNDEPLAMDVDVDVDESKTDTFAPGDFDDPEEIEAMEADFDSGDLDDIEDLMLPDDVDEVSTKLDLARAFIDMGDAEGARSSLEEVLQEGNDAQKSEAQELMSQL